MPGLIVALDASRNRSGGAREHLIGILENLDPISEGIAQIHIWSYKVLLDVLPAHPWLIKHSVPALEGGLLSQLWWQANDLSVELRKNRCDILFTSDASSLCRFAPSVVLSQDLLSYEPGVISTFAWGRARLRLIAIRYLQNVAFRRASGVIFLTQYAAKLIQSSCGLLNNIRIIPHGVNSQFFGGGERAILAKNTSDVDLQAGRIRCLYISNAALYKYQWVVVEAIGRLRKKGIPIELDLVGGGHGPAQEKIDAQIALTDPQGQFIRQHPFVPHEELLSYLTAADIFIFASGCEAFGITLLEAMAMGLPIAASNRSSIPETLRDGGLYFDPENPLEIAAAVEKIIQNPGLGNQLSVRARQLAKEYSWGRCSNETWGYIVDTYRKIAKP
ncbi:glycosyltransferase family 1 protein [Polynucleobacter sp. AP-Kaivos-20-H2]|uniref:glycosyltransferase family 4 protein n=1 Tax=Polynucleobacter sp. AP-Kaivos-20-H2 TaxID=2689104 RepID=UPI001C0DC059|nr:glycosyltransferase family 1 protein [Polynucleobacter sp. AP-Kaivos-20-H2]MBU3604113.1 glycosyltransferase family 4 protein [Polynucleobacter sp. AP-Kaivos-20-H2]